MAARGDAAQTCRAVLGSQALDAADPLAAHLGVRTIGVVRARLSTVALGRGPRQLAIDQLPGFRAGALGADLLRPAVGVGEALIAAVRVDATHLVTRTLAVVFAVAFDFELAHAERLVRVDAQLAGLAVTAVLALHVTGAERAHERRRAIRVDQATFGEIGPTQRSRFIRRAGRRESEPQPGPHRGTANPVRDS